MNGPIDTPTAHQTNNLICQFCSKQTSTEYNFCIVCDSQIKCLECGAKTVAGKDYCLKCSKPLAPSKKLESANNHYVRTVEKEGDNYKERTEFRLTDTAVGVMAPIILPATIPNYNIPKLPTTKEEDATEYEIIERNLNGKNNESDPIELGKLSNPQATNKNSSALSKYFTLDGETLVAMNTDFKGKSWADQQRNFLILYTKAFKEITGKAVPDKDHYKTAASRISIVDPNNFGNILSKLSKAKFTHLAEGFILNTEGEKDSQAIIKLIADEGSKPGYLYSQKSSTNTTKKHFLSKETKDLINTWVNENVDLGKLDIRNVKAGKEAGLLSLWILTVHLKKANALLWNEAIYYLSKKYETLSVSSESARKAFILKENENIFQKNSEDQYFLSIDGQKIVESWIAGTTELNKQAKK